MGSQSRQLRKGAETADRDLGWHDGAQEMAAITAEDYHRGQKWAARVGMVFGFGAGLLCLGLLWWLSPGAACADPFAGTP